MDVRDELLEGRRAIPRLGRVGEVNRAHPPYAMLDAAGAEVEPVTAYLRDLALGDSSPLTCRSYGYGILRWFRLLWLLGTDWERATTTSKPTSSPAKPAPKPKAGPVRSKDSTSRFSFCVPSATTPTTGPDAPPSTSVSPLHEPLMSLLECGYGRNPVTVRIDRQ